MLENSVRLKLLTRLLRLAGVVTIAAFPAMLLPTDWMASTHRWLGLGEFPATPVVDYLTRSVAALYGFHGALVLLVSRDPVRFRPIVTYIGMMNIVFGILMILVDLHARLPMFWVLGDGPPIIAFGICVFLLNKPARSPVTSQRGRGSDRRAR